VIHRQTQSAEFWNNFVLGSEDAELIYNHILDEGTAKRAGELARLIVRHRVERENASIRRQIDGQGDTYRPRERYVVGAALTFPILGFLTGVVTAVRPSDNAGLEPFEVITVKLSDSTTRDFASGYSLPHMLNDFDASTLVAAEDLKSPEALFDLYGTEVSARIDQALAKNPELIKIGEEWFLRAMMTDVNIGHLNLAEAVLEMAAGKPQTADLILRDLGLPEDVASSVQEASLNAALASDERFDDVSLSDRPAWVLRRAEPAEVRERPAALSGVPFSGAVTLSPELEALVAELDDELDEPSYLNVAEQESASVVLTFVHRRTGTLGWGRRLSAVLPEHIKRTVPVTLRDRSNNREFQVWLVRDGRYIWGLSDFYRSAELPAGAEITLTRTDKAHVFVIDAKRRKPKREWVRVASAPNGHLRMETAQRAVNCEFDDLMSVFVDEHRMNEFGNARDLPAAVREAFLEIAKLSPQGNVHARTLYAVVNTLMRASARAVMSALVANGTFSPVGDNYWHLGER
jgi:hypothetical protein